MKLKIFTIIAFVTLSISAFAQELAQPYPKVGDTIMDYTFTDMVNHPKKSFKIRDYRGQWLVLDFWGRFCSGCIASFPKMDKLQKQFAGEVQLLSVGLYSRDRDLKASPRNMTKNIYLSKLKRYDLKFPLALDSVIGGQLDIFGVPSIFVINPSGVIVAKSIELDSNQLASFIAGKIPKYVKSYSAHEKRASHYTYDESIPLLATGKMSNGGIDTSFLSRSVFTRWNPEMVEYYEHGLEEEIDRSEPRGYAAAIGLNLTQMYQLALISAYFFDNDDPLYRTWSRRIILELKDTSNFTGNKKRTSDNTYAWSANVPYRLGERKNFRKILLQDLNRSFGYESSVETRKVDVHTVIVKDFRKVQRLKTKGGTPFFEFKKDRPGFVMKNMPFSDLMRYGYLQQGLNAIQSFQIEYVAPLINKVDLDFNIDIDFDADTRDWADTLDQLRQYGFDVIPDKQDMKCIVIKDAKP